MKTRFTVPPTERGFMVTCQRHRFTGLRTDFATWAVFYGPPGGEK